MIKKMEDTTIPEPNDPQKDCNMTKTEIWKKQVSSYVKRAESYLENKSKLYSVIWGQCSETMKTKIQAFEAYEDLSEVKGISYCFETRENLYSAMHDAKVAVYTNKEGKDKTDCFKDTYQVVMHYRGSLCNDEVLILYEMIVMIIATMTGTNPTLDATDLERATKNAKNKVLAMSFFEGADKARYGLLQIKLKNNYSRGTDQYASNHATEAYKLVSYTKTDVARREPCDRGSDHDCRENGQGTDGVPFVQTNAQERVQCYNCQEMGHYATTCTNAARTRHQGTASTAGATETTFLMVEEESNAIETIKEESSEATMYSFNMTDESV